MQEKAKEPEIRFAGFTGAWEQRKLGELYEKAGSGGTPNASNASFYMGTIPFLGISDIKGRYITKTAKHISEKGLKSSAAWMVPSGAISLAMYASVGKVGITSVELATSQAFYNMVFASSSLRNFIFSRLEKASDNDEWLPLVSTGTQSNLNADKIKNWCISVPNSNEQKLVGEFFKKLDNLLTLHQRKYEKLLNIKKSMLEKMFPKEGEVVPEIRFKGFTGAWEQRKFGEMANRRSEVSASGNLPRVEYEDIVSGTGTLNKDVFEKQSQKQGIVFHSGDVLYGKLRPYLQNWLLASFNGLAVGDFWVLEPQGLNSNYLYRIIQTKQFDEIANQSVGTKMPRADWKLVSKATFLNPASFNEQRLIGKFFKDIDSLLTLHQRKLEMLKNVKQAFLEKMFV